MININPAVEGCAGGYVGEGEHFPAFRACSGSGGSGAGRRSRSSTYPPALRLVHLPRRPVAVALVLALLVVQGDEITPIRSRNSRFATSGIHRSGVLFMSMR